MPCATGSALASGRGQVDAGAEPERVWGAPLGGSRLLYTVKDLQALLGMGSDAVYGLIRSGRLAARKVGGKYVATWAGVESLLAYIDGAAGEPPPEAGLEGRF